ncbi:hypothetical protein RhiirC2_799563, partial [Rhizophagus irregularis]
MQYQDMKSKPLAQLMVPPSTNVIDKQNEANFQNKYDSTITALENVMRDTEVEPSKSTDPASEEDAILGNKAKKTGGKKSKPKSTLALLIPSSIQTQPIQASKKDTNNDNKNMDASYEKMVEKSTKILD